VLVDGAVAAATLGGSLALLAHGGDRFGPLGPASGELDWISGLLAACSSVPLLAWRRGPRAVFVFTASASVLLAGLGYPIGIPLGPTVALYLFAASRDVKNPWTRQNSVVVLALFLAYLSATALASGHYPWSEVSHIGLA
jgi:hypothetical protein